MVNIFEDYSLAGRNTFGVDTRCAYFIETNSVDDLKAKIVFYKNIPMMILGGGSNVLFTDNFNGAIFHLNSKGFRIISEDSTSVIVSAAAGEDWDTFVAYSVERGWGGLENLSLIPGNVGASPIQNIGAYGVEAKDSIVKVQGFYTDTFNDFELEASQCNFGYRDSIFKKSLKGRVFITHVWFKLQKNPLLVTHYGNLEDEMNKYGERNIANVRKAVISIRESKLPDPKVLGNAGSFFKNPIVATSQFASIQSQYPKVPSYPVNDEFVKVPAGWLIEMCGWKGKRIGNVGVHAQQALVLINYGGATGGEVLELAKSIQDSVNFAFGLSIDMEVNIY